MNIRIALVVVALGLLAAWPSAQSSVERGLPALPLTVANGGTGVATLTGVLVGNGTGVVTALSGTSAQVVLGTGALGAVPGLPLSGTTGSIGGGALGAGACATGTVNITGATTSMSASASPLLNADPTNGGVLGVSISARVSSAGVATVSVCAPIIGTPTAATYRVLVQ